MSAYAAGSVRAAPAITRRSIARRVRAGLATLKASPPMRLSDWAQREFYLSPEGSHTQGRWDAYPFQIAPLDWMGDDAIEEVDFKKSKRVGYTKMLLALMGFNAAHRRRKQALWQPTDDDRDSFVKSEVEPMLRDVRAVRAVRLMQATEDTLKLKSFVGSVLHLLGGKAARAYRRITVAAALLDELDGFDQQIEKSADPVTLARGRLEGAPFPKLVCGSTPRIKGLSHVDHRYQQAEAQMLCNIVCPHCSVEHPLLWGGSKVAHGFQWDEGRPETVRHVCPHCRGSITQAEYLQLWREWVWVDVQGRYRYGADRIWRDAQGAPCRAPRHVGVHVWAAYSPQRGWDDIVREFLQAYEKVKAGDVGPMQGFVNETLGEVWEESGDRADTHQLMERAEDYALATVPRGVLVLVAGIDVQDNRFEVVVWGIGRGEEMWVVDYKVLEANPADERDWAKLDAYLLTRFRHSVSGYPMGIEAAAIDTGGHFTHQVYNFARLREARRIVAVRGSRSYGGPIKGKGSRQDVNWRGTVIKRGVKLWDVGTDTAKDLIHGRLRITESGPGRVHFSRDLPLEFYEQLTAEIRVRQRTATGEQYRWVKRRARNEVLDCTVYALFAAQLLDLHRYTDAMWDRLQLAVEPAADLFSVSSVYPAQEHARQAEQPQTQAPPSRAAPSAPVAAARPMNSARTTPGFAREW
jgi:phage terminase large subunit GpA-like protein